jgi:dimethylglycine dehydrogenase
LPPCGASRRHSTTQLMTQTVETPSLRRSDASKYVAAEVRAARTAAGLLDRASIHATYEVTGPDAAVWLTHLLACRLPELGSSCRAPMLNAGGRLVGDMGVMRLGEGRFWLLGPYSLQEWHRRWFEDQLPAKGGVVIRNLSDAYLGVTLLGPRSREILASVAPASEALSDEAFPLQACRPRVDVGCTQAVVARRSTLTGELGYEITVPVMEHLALWRTLMEAGRAHGLTPVGLRAHDSMRLEKACGVWGREFTPGVTPAMCGLDAYVRAGGGFFGHEAFASDPPPPRRLALLEVTSPDADAAGNEPVHDREGRLVGGVTSGGYGYHVGKSLAFAYLDAAIVEDPALRAQELCVHIVGRPRTARVLSQPPFDPMGERLRS